VSLSKEDFWRRAEPTTEFADVLGRKLPLSAEHFRNNAGCAKNVDQILLLETVAAINSASTVTGSAGLSA